MLSRGPLPTFQNGSLSRGHPALLLSPCTLVRTQKLTCSGLVGRHGGPNGASTLQAWAAQECSVGGGWAAFYYKTKCSPKWGRMQS